MANITPIAKTRQLTAPAPVIRPTAVRQVSPPSIMRPAPAPVMPNVAKALIDSTPVSISSPRLQAAYQPPAPTQTVSEPQVPAVITAQKQAAAAILSPRTYSDAVYSPAAPTQTSAQVPLPNLIATTTKQEPTLLNIMPAVASIPSSDIAAKYQQPVIPSSLMRSTIPTYVEPVPSSPIPQVNQDPSASPQQQPSAMPNMLSTPLLSGGAPGLVRPGVYAPGRMRVRGVQDRYWGEQERGDTNVIVPQTYQAPVYDSDGKPMPLISGPGVVPYQQAPESSLDSAYKTVKVLALVGVGVGALYWLVGQLAPKVEFHS